MSKTQHQMMDEKAAAALTMATLFTSELLCVNFSGKCGSIPRSFLVLTISMDGLCAPGSSHFQGSRVVRIWKKILPRLYTSAFSVISVLLRNSSGDRHYPPLLDTYLCRNRKTVEMGNSNCLLVKPINHKYSVITCALSKIF